MSRSSARVSSKGRSRGRTSAFATMLVCLLASPAFAGDWVRPGPDSEPGIWGIEGGLKFAIPPSGFTGGDGGPRGLIRLGYPVLPGGRYDLVNFIAVEPVVNGHKGFSELELSQLDGVRGKRIWTDDPSGRLWSPEPGVEQLDVRLRVEAFLNGAQVSLLVSQRSDAPGEIRLTIHAAPESAPMAFCILTATMGNKTRARRLWLKDRTVSSIELYSDYRESGFTPHTLFGRDQFRRTPSGDPFVAITTDEEEGNRVAPWPAAAHWNYRGRRVTQYWKKSRETVRDELQVAVNARYTYWMSDTPIPGGLSYENFELREPFSDGQQLIFGITDDSPESLTAER